MGQLRIVTIESAIDLWKSNRVKEIFTTLIDMKMEGYKTGFKGKQNVLPFDGTDFIGTHQIICLEENAKLIPLLAYKSCTKNECDKYNMSFTAINSIATAKSKIHLDSINEFVNECDKQDLNIAYDSSLTVSPHVNKDPELGYRVYSVFFAICLLHRKEQKIDRTIMLANLDFQTDVMFKKMGSRPFSWNNEELSPIICPYLGFSNMQIFICDQSFSKKVLKLADDYKDLWENRILYSPQKENSKQLDAA